MYKPNNTYYSRTYQKAKVENMHPTTTTTSATAKATATETTMMTTAMESHETPHYIKYPQSK